MNLTWWRKRPSVHVADYDAQEALWAAQNSRLNFLDANNAIMMLDADTSQFSTMLMQLTNPGFKTITVQSPLPPQFAVGAFIDHDGMIHRIESITKKGSDDWFAPEEFVLGIRKPWIEKRETQPVYHWLEDDCMPRMGKAAEMAERGYMLASDTIMVVAPE